MIPSPRKKEFCRLGKAHLMREDEIDQVKLFVDLATNKINQQLKAQDNFSEGIYRILVNLDQVKDAVKKGEGLFFQNLSTSISEIKKDCEELTELAAQYRTQTYRLNNFFDLNNFSLKSVKDEFDFLNPFVDTLNENIKDINENIDNHIKKLEEITSSIKSLETSLKTNIEKINLNMSTAVGILEEFQNDKKGFILWKSKVIFGMFMLGQLISILLLLAQIGLLNLNVNLK